MKTILQDAKRKFLNIEDTNQEEEEVNILLLDEDVNIKKTKNQKEKNKKFLFIMGVISFLILATNLSIVLLNLALKYKNKTVLSTDVLLYEKFWIPSYFSLKEINPTWFKINSTAFGVLCCIEFLVLFSHLLQRSLVPELTRYRVDIFFAMFTGMCASLIVSLRGWLDFVDVVDKNFSCMECKETWNKPEVYFIFATVLVVLYGIYIASLITIMEKKYNSDDKEPYDLTIDFKFVVIGLLLVILVIYIIGYGYSIRLFVFNGLLEEFIKTKSVFILSFYPYFIHILVGIFLTSLYLDVKYIKLSLTQNLNTEYIL